ncbi:anti-sigma factor family protein, partial [Phenylobacterium soli]
MTREETLIAYVDGELAGTERARFEAEIAADPVLAREVARHRALADRVGAAFAPVLDEAIPPQLLAVAHAANDLGGAQPNLWRRVRPVAPWAGIAASLAIGVLAGRALLPQAGPLVAHDGALVAQGRIAQALDSQLAAEPGVVKVGFTLKAPDGRYCRTFESATDRLAGLACREDGRWVARTVTAWTPAAAS